MIRKASIRLEVDRQVIDLHYRVAGKGPALFLLHPSPLSSDFMQPLMSRLASRATVIAVDTPGYGASSRLKNDAGSLSIYVNTLMRFVDALGLEKYAIYGSATGAQIAIEAAKTDKDRVSGILLDNAAAFTDEQRAAITEGYFPDLIPREDGSHLAAVWQVAHDSMLFFPWHQRVEDNRIAPALGPVEAMQANTMGYLEAGPDYHVAYRAAFENERAERLMAVEVPVTVIRWQGSILKKYTSQLDDFSWNENVRMAACDADPEARWQCLESELERVLPDISVDADSLEHQDGSFFYVDFEGGQLCCHGVPAAGGRLVIHAPGSSARCLEGVLMSTGDLSFDLPGHGFSDGENVTLDVCARAARTLMKKYEPGSVAAVGDGYQIAKQVDPDAVQLVTNTGQSPPGLELQQGGGHLLEGWHWLRRLRPDLEADPTQLTAELVALFRSVAAHKSLYRDIHSKAVDE